MGIMTRLTNVRISYPKLFEAESSAQFPGNKKYSATFLIQKGSSDAKAIESAMADATRDKFSGKKVAMAAPSVYDGDDDDKVNVDPRNAGYLVLRTSRAESQGAPGVFDQKAQKVMDRSLIYPGCYVNADVDVYIGTTGGNRVCFSLAQVQFVGDGERLDGAVPPPAFEPVADQDVPDFLS